MAVWRALAMTGSMSVKLKGGVAFASATTCGQISRSRVPQSGEGSAVSPRYSPSGAGASCSSAALRRRTSQNSAHASSPEVAAAIAQAQVCPCCQSQTPPSASSDSHGNATARTSSVSGQ